MGQQTAFEETCERYLLGELSETEQEQFEEAYFEDDALFEEFLAVKDELLDAYARGELAKEKRQRFAAHFAATAARRQQVDETREFIRAVTAVSAKTATTQGATVKEPLTIPKSSWRQSFSSFFKLRSFAWQVAFAAILLIALGGTWVFVRYRQASRKELAAGQPTPLPTIAARPINENNNRANPAVNDNTNTTPGPTPANVTQSPANINQSTVNKNAAPTATPQKPANRPPQISAAQIASVLLLPVASRDINESNTLRLGSDTRKVRLQLVFKSDDYRSYSAALTTVSGAPVWQQKTLKAGKSGANKSVTLQFAPALLRGQDYIVTLKGMPAKGQAETIGEYYFRVERSPN